MPEPKGLRPIPSDAPVARESSGIVVGVTREPSPGTHTSTSDGSYKTEFVKVYQDAGVIGLSMLTLLVLCFLLGMFSLRLLRMYVSLTESRDKLETVRSAFFEKITERLLTLESKVEKVTTELRSDHIVQTGLLTTLVDGQNRFDERMDRMQDREVSRDRTSTKNERAARDFRESTEQRAISDHSERTGS